MTKKKNSKKSPAQKILQHLKSAKVAQPIERDTIFVSEDLFPYCIWDEDLGTMVSRHGVIALFDKVKAYLRDGWRLDKLSVEENDDDAFVIQLSKPSHPLGLKKEGICV